MRRIGAAKVERELVWIDPKGHLTRGALARERPARPTARPVLEVLKLLYSAAHLPPGVEEVGLMSRMPPEGALTMAHCPNATRCRLARASRVILGLESGSDLPAHPTRLTAVWYVRAAVRSSRHHKPGRAQPSIERRLGPRPCGVVIIPA